MNKKEIEIHFFVIEKKNHEATKKINKYKN